jgi:polyisoprenoid-binding protein YceI
MVTRIRAAGICTPLLTVTLMALVYSLAMAEEVVPQGKLAVLDLNPAKTTITYSLEGWPHHTQGTFALRHGVIRIEPSTGKMDGTITVDAASGNSGHSVRDERMKSSVLEASRFPEISFVPRQVVSHGNLQGEFPVTVRGLMLLHGAQHDFKIDALVKRKGNRVTIRCNFVIPYVEWGLEDPSILMFKVSKEVHVDVTTNAHLSWIPSTAMPMAYFQRHFDIRAASLASNLGM